jgi:serine/threonine-protein kinase HipA
MIQLEADFSHAHKHYAYYACHDFFVFGQSLGLSNMATKSLIKKLCSLVKRRDECTIDSSQCPDDMNIIIKSHIADRLERMT